MSSKAIVEDIPRPLLLAIDWMCDKFKRYAGTGLCAHVCSCLLHVCVGVVQCAMCDVLSCVKGRDPPTTC